MSINSPYSIFLEETAWKEQEGKYSCYILVHHVYQLLEEEKRHAFSRYLENKSRENQFINTSSSRDKDLWNMMGLKPGKHFKRAKLINLSAFSDKKKGLIATSKNYSSLAEKVLAFEPLDHQSWVEAANKNVEAKKESLPIAVSLDPNKLLPDILIRPASKKRSHEASSMPKKRRELNRPSLPSIASDTPAPQLTSLALHQITSSHDGTKEIARGPAQRDDVLWLVSGNNFASPVLHFQLYYYLPPSALSLPQMFPIQVNPLHVRPSALSLKAPSFLPGNYSVVAAFVSNHPAAGTVFYSNALSYEAYLPLLELEVLSPSQVFVDDVSNLQLGPFDDTNGTTGVVGEEQLFFQNSYSSNEGNQNYYRSKGNHVTPGEDDHEDEQDAYMDFQSLEQLLNEHEKENDDDDGEEEGEEEQEKSGKGAPGFFFDMRLTQWHMACSNGDLDLLRDLQHACAPGVSSQDAFGRTPLYLAAFYGRFDILRQLFHPSLPFHMLPDPNICDNDGVFPLHLLCSYGNVECVELLLRNGAKLNVYTKNVVSPLFPNHEGPVGRVLSFCGRDKDFQWKTIVHSVREERVEDVLWVSIGSQLA